MKGDMLKPKDDDVKTAIDRLELFHSMIVNYIIHQSAYKLDKEYSKYIDDTLENLEKGQQHLLKKYFKR